MSTPRPFLLRVEGQDPLPRLYVTETGQIVQGTKVHPPEPSGPRPPLPGLLKFVVNYLTTGLDQTYKAANIIHAWCSDPTQVSQGNLNTLCTSLGAAWASNFNITRTPAWLITGYQLVALDGSGLEATSTASVAGTGSTNPLSPQSTVTVSWGTKAYWRGGKFRTYLPGIPGNALSTTGGAGLTATYANSCRNAGNSFLTAANVLNLGTIPIEIGGVSYFHQYAFRTPPLFLPYLTAHVHERLDSQRRRSGKESSFTIS